MLRMACVCVVRRSTSHRRSLVCQKRSPAYQNRSPPCLTRSYYNVPSHTASSPPHSSKQQSEVVMVVDLRSDTVTKPPQGMKQAMMEAPLGDDVYGEDPTILELEERVAHLTGKDAALFVPSGTMGNLISLLAHCDHRGSEVLLGDLAHIFLYEQGGMSQLGGIQPHIIPTHPDGTYDAREIRHRLSNGDDVHCTKTALVCIENTHNKCGGKVLPLEWIDQVGEVSRSVGVPVHMDGARLMNAAVASGVSVSRILQACNTASMCFSKALCTPAGSVLVGSHAFKQKALRIRKVLGGGMRQAGMLAAAALYSLDHMVDRLSLDHAHAHTLAQAIHASGSKAVWCEPADVHTNILVVEVNPSVWSPIEFSNRMAMVKEEEIGAVGGSIVVKFLPWTNTSVRLVTHHDVSSGDVEATISKLNYVLGEMEDAAATTTTTAAT